MFKQCIVTKCTNNSKTCTNKIFISVPRNESVRNKWMTFLDRHKKLNWFSNNLYVCEDHFNMAEDFENWQYFKMMGGNLRVRTNVLPHKQLGSPLKNPSLSQLSNNDPPVVDKIEDKFIIIPSTRSITGSDSSVSVTELLHSSYAPSISSEDTPNEVALNRNKSTLYLVETKSRFYLGIPRELYLFVKKLSTETKLIERDILITLKKIRQGDSYERLGEDFEIGATNVQKIFTKCVPIMANVIQEQIFWPDAFSIKCTLPIAFRLNFHQVESIIDCFEIEIEKPSDPERQVLTWSDYKKCNTLKYLISSTPSGIVTFVSRAYRGDTTDKKIVEKSGYLEVLPEGAHVMADRGFKHVAGLLATRNNKLIRPLSVMEGTKMTEEQARLNKNIASLRVHVEKVINRLREFKMLTPHAKVNHDLLYLMNNIVIIACGIINIQGPLLKT